MSETEVTQEKAETTRLRSARLTAEKALPQSGAETLVKIIKGYAVASNGGESQINYKDVASAAGLGPSSVSANNKFLLESQFLISPKYGFYVPSEGAVRFARESAWDESGAKSHLRKVVLGCWYGQVVAQNFAMRSSLSRDDLKRALGIKCGATEGDSNALEFLTDFIIYTGLAAENENGTLTKGNFDEAPSVAASAPDVQGTTGLQVLPSASQSPLSRSDSTQVAISLHIHIHDPEQLTPEYAGKIKSWLQALRGEMTDVQIDGQG